LSGEISDSGISDTTSGTVSTRPITPPIATVAFARKVRRDCSSGVPGSW
jgi:hypothetical protein